MKTVAIAIVSEDKMADHYGVLVSSLATAAPPMT